MTERESLLRAVCADPDDDTVRLAFADWCDENGEPERAEFVRVQVELARMEREWGPRTTVWTTPTTSFTRYTMPDESALLDRERELLHDCWPGSVMNNESAWIAPLLLLIFGPGAAPVTPGQPRNEGRVFRWEWGRGFVSRVTCTQSDFLRHAADIFRSHPVTAVTLGCREHSDPGARTGNVYWHIRDPWDYPDGRFDSYTHHAHPDIGKHLWDDPETCGKGSYLAPMFPSSAAAHRALSRAAVAYGRALAGLPPLRMPSKAITGSVDVGRT